jgi:hypothetical protein
MKRSLDRGAIADNLVNPGNASRLVNPDHACRQSPSCRLTPGFADGSCSRARRERGKRTILACKVVNFALSSHRDAAPYATDMEGRRAQSCQNDLVGRAPSSSGF